MKQKKKKTAKLLAIFLGPLSLLYVRRPFKVLLYFILFSIPLVNLWAYFHLIFSIGGEVEKYNIKVSRKSLELCNKCSYANFIGNKHCTSCGSVIKRDCKKCNAPNSLINKFCFNCGNKFRFLSLKNFIAII